MVSVISGGSVGGSSGELADDTDESSVLVFQPLVIGTQVNKNLWGRWGRETGRFLFTDLSTKPSVEDR